MEESRKKLYQKCKKLLLKKKEELLNGMRSLKPSLKEEVTGDEADLAQTFMSQNSTISQQERIKHLVQEIDAALSRMEDKTYGVCEETEEPIEADRLLAIPWTRFSLVAAESQEARRKRFA